jgi:hypothetical protein
MIVRILSIGSSFKGCADYLTHDADHAKTAERVAWTHTHNLANDDIPCAVNEMVWTARDAEFLKQEAGIRAGGRATENPVKHLSLNWAQDQNPTREQMIEATEDFLRHMKWQEHQAIFVAHDDKAYKHVHVMLNVIHPETGLRLNDDFERRRAQAWALEYEREHGRIYCEQRLLNPEDRERELPRNVWETFRDSGREFEKFREIQRENNSNIDDPVKNRRNSEWEILKEAQRLERVEHFNSGKSEFKECRNSIYREVRGEFRERWSDYYKAVRNGGDFEELAERKAKLIAERKEALESRRDKALAELRTARDERYLGLLDRQQDARDELHWRQELGLDNAGFLNEAGHPDAAGDVRSGFHQVATEVTKWPAGRHYETIREIESEPADTGREASRGRGGDDVRINVGLGGGAILGSLLSFVLNGGSPPPPPPRPSKDLFEAAAEETAKREQREREAAEDEARQKQRSPQ